MTDNSDDMKARAKRAFERSIIAEPGELHGPIHPEELAVMERAILSLPRTTRAIFLARRLDGYSYDHIARMTGLSQCQIERRMSSAIHCLGRYRRGDERSQWQRWWQACVPRRFR